MLKLIWHEQARQSLRSIITYISERNPSAAEDVRSRIDLCTERLTDHPYMYRTGRVEGTREAVVHPNYRVVYRVAPDIVEILDVMHTRREYPPSDHEA